jgi:hypothetical protein
MKLAQEQSTTVRMTVDRLCRQSDVHPDGMGAKTSGTRELDGNAALGRRPARQLTARHG